MAGRSNTPSRSRRISHREPPSSTDRTKDEISLDEVERVKF
jgi:hypothetical protein